MRLIIIEDEEDYIEMYEEYVENFNEGSDIKIESTIARTLDEAENILSKGSFDAGIVDLQLGAGDLEASGNEVIKEIIGSHKFPVYVVSGNLKDLEKIDELKDNPLFKSFSRDDLDMETLIKEIYDMYNTGLTKLLGSEGKMESIMKDIFWRHSKHLVKDLMGTNTLTPEDKEEILFRYTASCIRENLVAPVSNLHPGEVYIFPPIAPDITTGDLLKDLSNNQLYIVLTPACDLVKRKGGKRNTNLATCCKLTLPLEALQDMKECGTKGDLFKGEEITKKGREKIDDIKNKRGKDCYCYLPPFVLIQESIVNFKQINTFSLIELEDSSKFERICSVSETFLRDIISKFSNFYGRQGSPEVL